MFLSQAPCVGIVRIVQNHPDAMLQSGGHLMTTKEKAASFLKMAGTGDVQNAYDKFVAPAFVHHNQYFKGDRQSQLS
jgi:hypothetical protein